MTDLPQIEQCQCAYCCASRALDVLRGLPYLPDDGRAALDAIEAALDKLEQDGFARWDSMNDVATAAGLNWMDATQQDIVGAIEQTRARVAELEAAAQWRPVTERPPAAGRYFVQCRPQRLDDPPYPDAANWDGENWNAAVISWRP